MVTPLREAKVVAEASKSGANVTSRTRPVKSLGENAGFSTALSKNKSMQQPIPKQAELKDDWSNLKYITKHKYNIIGPGRDLGLGYGQLLKHDLSKLSPSEWGPYRDYWFSDKGVTGKNDPEIRKIFRTAATKHKAKNPHHTQSDTDPFKYRLEEVVDWYASAKTQTSDPKNFPEFISWYSANRERFINDPTNPVDFQVDFYIKRRLGL